jgi:hypothetical protein
VQAVAEGKFHLYPVCKVDEGLEILTGLRAGTVGDEGTLNEAVNSRLKELALGLKAFTGGDHRGEGGETRREDD